MFKRVGGKIIETEESFSVSLAGRDGVKYSQGEKTLIVEAEIMTSRAGRAIYQNSIQNWDPPHSAELIDDKSRDKIVDNIVRAFAWADYYIVIDKNL